MRFLYSLFITAVVVEAVAIEAVSKSSDGKISKPEDAGILLKETYGKLADIYSSKRPNSEEELIEGTRKVLKTFCTDNDSECHDSVDKLTEKEVQDVTEEPQELVLPDNLDPALAKSVEKMQETLQQLNLGNKDVVLDQLNSIKMEIEDMDDVRPVDKDAVLVGANIALESVKLWNGVYNDPGHPLYGIHYPSHYLKEDVKEGRKLKEIDMAEIALSDFQAGIDRAMKQMVEGQDLKISGLARSFLARDMMKCFYWYWKEPED